jgi:hypothetical protein
MGKTRIQSRVKEMEEIMEVRDMVMEDICMYNDLQIDLI